jgi:hypothetical protein
MQETALRSISQALGETAGALSFDGRLNGALLHCSMTASSRPLRSGGKRT